jgi:hypothetical protein
VPQPVKRWVLEGQAGDKFPVGQGQFRVGQQQGGQFRLLDLSGGGFGGAGMGGPGQQALFQGSGDPRRGIGRLRPGAWSRAYSRAFRALKLSKTFCSKSRR